ncbi:MAG: isoprenyl transferase [Acidobacteria bacterium]|nr:MAG: isoprenyl transferase [Acidobacteriota bacterium]
MHTTIPAGLTRKQAELFAKLDPERLPRHIGIIMDGNGRWAKRRHLPRIAGHKRGVTAVRDVVTLASNINLPALTLYAFSAENWKRPKTEINFLMALLRTYLKNEVPLMNEHNIQLRYIGRIHELAPEVQERMAWATEQTARNTGMIMTLALNYGGRAELIDAFQSIVRAAANNGGLEHLKIDEELVSRHLYSNLPDPDMVIRTSGEMRLSNFLLWQLAYSEIYVTQTLWPDFTGADLLEAIADFQKRERRYGNVGAAV